MICKIKITACLGCLTKKLLSKKSKIKKLSIILAHWKMNYERLCCVHFVEALMFGWDKHEIDVQNRILETNEICGQTISCNSKLGFLVLYLFIFCFCIKYWYLGTVSQSALLNEVKQKLTWTIYVLLFCVTFHNFGRRNCHYPGSIFFQHLYNSLRSCKPVKFCIRPLTTQNRITSSWTVVIFTNQSCSIFSHSVFSHFTWFFNFLFWHRN